MKWRGILAFALVAMLAGCTKPETQFERHVQALQRSLATNELARPIRYDIRRTDSLVSPLVGQIEYIEILSHFNNPITGTEWLARARRFTLAYQDRAWALVNVDVKIVFSSDRLDEQPYACEEERFMGDGHYKRMLGIK